MISSRTSSSCFGLNSCRENTGMNMNLWKDIHTIKVPSCQLSANLCHSSVQWPQMSPNFFWMCNLGLSSPYTMSCHWISIGCHDKHNTMSGGERYSSVGYTSCPKKTVSPIPLKCYQAAHGCCIVWAQEIQVVFRQRPQVATKHVHKEAVNAAWPCSGAPKKASRQRGWVKIWIPLFSWCSVIDLIAWHSNATSSANMDSAQDMLRPSSGIAVESAAEPWETTVCFRATSSVNPTNSNGLRMAQGSIQSTNKTILVQGETSYVDRKEYWCSTMITMAE